MRSIIEILYFYKKGNLALCDGLTGCYNRNWWELFGTVKYNNEVLYVTVIDVNGLKRINDTYGHSAGDAKIIQTANALKTSIPGAKIARIGGDEFVILSRMDITPVLKAVAPVYQFSYGVRRKDLGISVRSAFEDADYLMYKMKAQEV